MSRIVQMEVLDVREHPVKPDSIQVKVKVPMKDGLETEEWFEPNMHEVKRRYRVRLSDPRTWDGLVGKRLRIPEMEVEAEKAGYHMVKRRKWKG